MAPEIQAGRQFTINTPSVIRAEFTREIEELDKFRHQINVNIRAENSKQQKKIQKMKAKYDREGVNFIEDEKDIGR